MSATTFTKYDAVKYRTPTTTHLNCKGWIQEAALRMLLNNLDPDVTERSEDLIVYGGRGKAARNFDALDKIIKKFLQVYHTRIENPVFIPAVFLIVPCLGDITYIP